MRPLPLVLYIFAHLFTWGRKKKGQQKFNSIETIVRIQWKRNSQNSLLKSMNNEKDQTYDEFSSKYGYSIKALSSIAEIQRLRERQNNLKNSYNYVSNNFFSQDLDEKLIVQGLGFGRSDPPCLLIFYVFWIVLQSPSE